MFIVIRLKNIIRLSCLGFVHCHFFVDCHHQCTQFHNFLLVSHIPTNEFRFIKIQRSTASQRIACIATQSTTTRFVLNQKSKQMDGKIRRASSNQCIKNKLIIDTVQFIWRSLIEFSNRIFILKWLAASKPYILRFEKRERDNAFIVNCIKESSEILFCSCALLVNVKENQHLNKQSSF